METTESLEYIVLRTRTGRDSHLSLAGMVRSFCGVRGGAVSKPGDYDTIISRVTCGSCRGIYSKEEKN